MEHILEVTSLLPAKFAHLVARTPVFQHSPDATPAYARVTYSSASPRIPKNYRRRMEPGKSNVSHTLLSPKPVKRVAHWESICLARG